MSWSAMVEAVVAADDHRVELVLAIRQPQTGHGEEESVRAIESAMAAVRTILRTGALGSGRFKASLFGHSNPGSHPAEGWGNDNLGIQIVQHHDG